VTTEKETDESALNYGIYYGGCNYYDMQDGGPSCWGSGSAHQHHPLPLLQGNHLFSWLASQQVRHFENPPFWKSAISKIRHLKIRHLVMSNVTWLTMRQGNMSGVMIPRNLQDAGHVSLPHCQPRDI
jgi:hypothetical protein